MLLYLRQLVIPGESPAAGTVWAGSTPCCKLLMQQDWENSISWPPAVPDYRKMKIQHLRTCSPDGERKEKPLPSDRRQKTKIHFSNSSQHWWLISYSHSLMHINQIINNFFGDYCSATVLSTRTALTGIYWTCDQTTRTQRGGVWRNCKMFKAIWTCGSIITGRNREYFLQDYQTARLIQSVWDIRI